MIKTLAWQFFFMYNVSIYMVAYLLGIIDFYIIGTNQKQRDRAGIRGIRTYLVYPHRPVTVLLLRLDWAS